MQYDISNLMQQLRQMRQQKDVWALAEVKRIAEMYLGEMCLDKDSFCIKDAPLRPSGICPGSSRPSGSSAQNPNQPANVPIPPKQFRSSTEISG